MLFLNDIPTTGSNYTVYGIVAEMRYHIPLFKREPQLGAGIATVVNSVPESAIIPVFENLSWGYIKRYSLHQRHIGKAEVIWRLSDYFNPYARYFVQSEDLSSRDTSDELDAGIILEFKKGLITLNTAFVALNMVGSYLASYGVYIELRTIIGRE